MVHNRSAGSKSIQSDGATMSDLFVVCAGVSSLNLALFMHSQLLKDLREKSITSLEKHCALSLRSLIGSLITRSQFCTKDFEDMCIQSANFCDNY